MTEPAKGSFNEEWAERMREAMAAELTPRRAEQRRLGDALRHLIDKLVNTEAPLEEIRRAADAAEQLAKSFEGHRQGRTYDGFAESANAGTPRAFFDHSPMMGPANPLAPPASLIPEGDMVVGRVTFGAAYEGPPGCVHGGYVAAVFDELLGMTQSLGGQPGMTGTLTIRYRRPTPLHRELRLEGEIVAIEGRKTSTVGRCLLDGELISEAEGVFISVDLNRIAELYARREERRGRTGDGRA
ncbi:MAG TPA: PaaI family thioesterase [Acidimicrobiales bacterium]|nr:PaaI family thioesterase [Acidimicrobiales bacterium]